MTRCDPLRPLPCVTCMGRFRLLPAFLEFAVPSGAPAVSAPSWRCQRWGAPHRRSGQSRRPGDPGQSRRQRQPHHAGQPRQPLGSRSTGWDGQSGGARRPERRRAAAAAPAGPPRVQQHGPRPAGRHHPPGRPLPLGPRQRVHLPPRRPGLVAGLLDHPGRGRGAGRRRPRRTWPPWRPARRRPRRPAPATSPPTSACAPTAARWSTARSTAWCSSTRRRAAPPISLTTPAASG